jgi:tetratricopeptide (TPR) repeat protein
MNNSVFISYRRDASAYLALAVYQDLHSSGIDAFYDIESIDVGQFDTVILNQIAARPYFLPILTPGTLDRCADANDWVRKEIEYALSLKRAIVPLHTPEFDFGDVDRYLPAATAAELKRFNAVEIPHRYFRYAMTDVRTRFLKPIALATTPAPTSDAAVVAQKVAKIQIEPPVTEEQLTAHEYFERGRARPKTDIDGKIADYSEVIRLNPQYAKAYCNRGLARYNKGDLDGAIADYDEALRLDPQFDIAYYNRAFARADQKDYMGAVADGQKAIDLQIGDLFEETMQEKIAAWSELMER